MLQDYFGIFQVNICNRISNVSFREVMPGVFGNFLWTMTLFGVENVSEPRKFIDNTVIVCCFCRYWTPDQCHFVLYYKMSYRSLWSAKGMIEILCASVLNNNINVEPLVVTRRRVHTIYAQPERELIPVLFLAHQFRYINALGVDII